MKKKNHEKVIPSYTFTFCITQHVDWGNNFFLSLNRPLGRFSLVVAMSTTRLRSENIYFFLGQNKFWHKLCLCKIIVVFHVWQECMWLWNKIRPSQSQSSSYVSLSPFTLLHTSYYTFPLPSICQNKYEMLPPPLSPQTPVQSVCLPSTVHSCSHIVLIKGYNSLTTVATASSICTQCTQWLVQAKGLQRTWKTHLQFVGGQLTISLTLAVIPLPSQKIFFFLFFFVKWHTCWYLILQMLLFWILFGRIANLLVLLVTHLHILVHF